MPRGKREHYTLICKVCGKVIMMTRSTNYLRPRRYGLCGLHRPKKWNHRDAPLT